jgi:ABC-type transport system substrate-binding protein
METPNYWQRLAKRRLSRRRLLAGAAAGGAGLAALSLVGCGGNDQGAPAASATTTPGAETPSSTADGLSLETTDWRWEPVKEGCRGGIFRWFGFDAIALDTFDPHQTQFGPIAGTHSAVFSRVLKYDDIPKGIIETDLAETIPETPDKLTYVVKLRPNVRFHDTEKARKSFPQVAGRQLTAEDVKYSVERQINKESPKSVLYYRMSQWETLDKIEVLDPLTIKFVTKQPTAPFVHFLADTHAFIIARELVDPATDDMNNVDTMIGTGPFVLDRFVGLQSIRCLRNPDWFAKDDRVDKGLPDRPILDGIEAIWTPQDDTATEVAYKSKQVDRTEYVNQDNVDRIAEQTGAVIDSTPSTGWVNSRILINDSENATTPFKDLRLRQAIHIAVDRNRMAQQLYQHVGFPCGPVHPGILRWALPLEELYTKPGYRFAREEREKDLADAKAMWEAAGGPSIGTVEVVYPAIPDFVKNYWPQFQRQLKETLGLDTKGTIDATGYTQLTQGMLRKSIVFTFAYDNGWNDLDDWVYPYFHSRGAKNSFMLADPELDRLLEAQRVEFEYEKRRDLGYEIQRYLLDKVAARIDWASYIARSTNWPYRKNGRPNPWFGTTWQRANEWLDRTDPTYEGRPA